MSFFDYPNVRVARRAMLLRSGAVLSGAAVALLAGRDVLAATAAMPPPATSASSIPRLAPSTRRLRRIRSAPKAACCKSRCSISP